MGGRLYYTFSPKPGVRFFALDANSTDPAQAAWLEDALGSASEPWKIAFFHHPLYSSGTGADARLRDTGSIDPRSGITAKGFDADRAFLAAEIIGDEMHFAAISRSGEVVDSGVARRRAGH